MRAIRHCSRPGDHRWNWHSGALHAALSCLLLCGIATADDAEKPAPIARPDVLPKAEIYRQTLQGTAMVVGFNDQTKSSTSGTAWVVDKENCLLITNDHVVAGFDSVHVYFPVYRRGQLMTNAEHYRKNVIPLVGWIVDTLPEKDLAVIRVAALPTNTRQLEIVAPENDIVPGEEAYSIGNPPGSTDSLWIFTTGTVRQIINAEFRVLRGQLIRARIVEAQSPINPGDSGGPVVNDRGEIVAVVEARDQAQSLRSAFIHASEVRDYLESVREWIDPETAEQLYRRGQNYLLKGRYRQALNDFDEAASIEPRNAVYISARGEAHYNLGAYDAAAADFSESLKINPDMEMALCLRGWCYVQKGQLRSAKDDFTDALTINPRLGRAYAGRAKIEHDSGAIDKAIDELTTAIRHEPAFAHHYESRGDLYFSANDNLTAVKDFSEAMRLSSRGARLLRKRADSYRDAGFFAEALADYEQAINFGGDDAPALSGRSQLMLRRRRFDQALADIDQAITKAPTIAIYHVQKGNILLVAGKDEEANQAYQQAAEIDARVLAENRFRDLRTFNRRNLYVINRTPEPIKFHVLFFTQASAGSQAYWYPGAPGTPLAAEAQSWEVEPGFVVQPIHKFSATNSFPVRGSKVRIWGEGLNTGRQYTQYKNDDLLLCPDGPYKSPKEENFYYVFE